MLDNPILSRSVDNNVGIEYPSFIDKIESHWTYIPPKIILES